MTANLEISLEDSCLNGKNLSEIDKNLSKDIAIKAIDKLNSESQRFISFINKSQKEQEKIIWYESSANDIKIFTSHFVGFYSTMIDEKQVNITINPRFGKTITNHLFSYALGFYMSPSLADSSNDKSNLWLITQLWVNALEEAIRHSHTPKTYDKIERNERFYKGNLNIHKHIISNLTNKERFHCKYSKQTYNTAINRAIRKAFGILSKKPQLARMLRSIVSYEKTLCDFGVSDRIEISEFSKIHYTPLTKPYKKVMELSKAIIEYQGAQSVASRQKSFGYFIDMSEIWENYLYKLMQRNLGDFEVINGNLNGEEFLFEGNLRAIRPDFVINTKCGKIIIDAKYKDYDKIGKTASENNSVNREDLYQIITYMCHYNANLGIILSPKFRDKEPSEATFNTAFNGKGKMLVFGMNLDSVESSDEKLESKSSSKQNERHNIYEKIKIMENDFVENLKNTLMRFL